MLIALKIEVHTEAGARAIPALRAMLERAGLRASFFAALGPDSSGRLARYLPHVVWSPAPLARAHGVDLRRLAFDGHEVGLAGWDAECWKAGAAAWPECRVSSVLEPALELFNDVLGRPARAFAAPGSLLTPALVGLEERLGLEYASDCHGREPFYTSKGTQTSSVLQVPGTLPRIRGLIGRDGLTVDSSFGLIERSLRPDALNVYTASADVEGRDLLEPFARFVTRLQRSGARFVRLCDAARRVTTGVAPVPVCALAPRTLLDSNGPVLTQGDMLRTSVRSTPFRPRVVA